MPAPIGNQFAKGNKGGKPYSQKNREKATTLKGLVLDEAIKIMKNKSKDAEKKRLRELVIAKILSTCVPRPFEIGSESENPLIIQFDSDPS